MAKKKGEYIEFNDHEVFAKVIGERSKDFDAAVSEVDALEAQEGRMSEEQIELEKKADAMNTQRQKEKFANIIKSGLGEKIREKPNEIKIVKKKKTIIQIIKEFFTKF